MNGIFSFIPWYIAAFFVGTLVIYLNRKRKYAIASSVLLIFANLLVFVIADVGNPERGVFLFFIVTAVTGLVLFYHSNLNLGIAFVVVSIVLAMLAYYFDLHLFEQLPDDGRLVKINFTANFIIGIASAVLVVLFIIRRNNESEWFLVKKKDELEALTKELQQKNAALEKANKELDSFVYSASHDLRAPLSTLLGLIEVIRITDSTDELPNYLEMMARRIHDMEGFIKDVTDYARNSRLGLAREQFKLAAFIDKLIVNFDLETTGTGLQITHDIDPEMVVNTDPNRLKVVVNNLLNNAIKYHDPGKERSFVRLSATLEDGDCTLIIEDNGIGIAWEYQDKIFDMFFRATEQSTGSGLGLYILKETLHRIGGRISFQSQPTRGSKFVVEFPAT